MDQKVQLIGDCLKDEHTITELSHIYSVSRKTIYKWIERYDTKGPEGLDEQCRAPFNHPNATGPEIVNQLIDTKLKHKNWGPKKIVARLKQQYPDSSWPVPSTVGNILKKEGLVNKRLLNRHTPPIPNPSGSVIDLMMSGASTIKGNSG